MKDTVKINTALGWTLVVGITIIQFIVTNAALNLGQMAFFNAFLIAIIFLPFTATAIAGVLNREQSLSKTKFAIKVGLLLQLVLPTILPLYFDSTYIYLSLLGVLFGLVMWCFRKSIEVQLLILNGIGLTIWILISLVVLMIS